MCLYSPPVLICRNGFKLFSLITIFFNFSWLKYNNPTNDYKLTKLDKHYTYHLILQSEQHHDNNVDSQIWIVRILSHVKEGVEFILTMGYYSRNMCFQLVSSIDCLQRFQQQQKWKKWTVAYCRINTIELKMWKKNMYTFFPNDSSQILWLWAWFLKKGLGSCA